MLPKTKTKTNPNSRACLPCREKHLKCDGQPPPCNRCAAAGADLACTYVQSRRGRRAPTARSSTAATHDRPAAAQPSQMLAFSTPAASHVADSLGSHGQQGFPSAPLANRPTHSGAEQQLQQNDALSEDTISMPYIDSGKPDDDYLITLYYQFIHPAHPFLLPLKLYRQNRNIFPDHLKQAVYYIASFHSSVSSEQHEDEFEALFGPEVPNDAFKVQSLILITLASYARFQRDRGNKALNAAISVAYQIGLNLEDFFRGDEALFRESWRRTWWELYSIAGLISLISGVNVRLSQPTDMTLPYECDAYNECQTRYMGSARDMKERYRTDSTTTWSSFAYRVEAMRILSMVLDLSLSTSSSDKLAAEAAVSGWVLSLPEGKRDGLRENGETDEVMSCALMIIHLAGICLHLPQSSLIRTGDFRTVCGNDFRPLASDSPKLHQAAALRSANALARLLTTHSDLRTLSPCFSCAVAYSSVVLLAEYSIHAIPKPLYLGENLQLELNALQSIGHTWPIAGVVRGQLAAFARDTMRRPSESNATELLDLDPSLIDEQWLQDLVGDTTALPI